MQLPIINYQNSDGTLNRALASRDVLCEYFILTLNPELNSMLLVSSQPVTGKPVFLNLDDVLVPFFLYYINK